MSDPVTNAQIEDVLSSIRRLVSDDGRPADPAAATESAVGIRSDSAPAKPDRLVLTPALRVTDTESPATGTEEGTPEPEETLRGPAPWSAPDATLFAAVGEELPEGEAREEETAEEEASVDNEAPAIAASAGPADDLDPPHLDEAETEDDAASTDDAADDATDGAGQMPDHGAWDGFEGEGAEIPDQPPTFHSTRAENLSAKIEALEAVIGRTRDQWEPDGTSDDAYAGTPVEGIGWHEVDGDSADTAAEAPDDLAFDEAVIDEDSLRELVAEIVRQELQGALGERITRNVRKLVRREIHRVLASQDLD